MSPGVTRLLQVTPTIHARGSADGDGEKIFACTDRALRLAATESGENISAAVLSFGVDPAGSPPDHDIHHRVIAGSPWEVMSIDAPELVAELRRADVVYVNQCLHPVGMFVAAHARLLGRRVIGMDAGAGNHPDLARNPGLALIYHGFHAISRFAMSEYSRFGVPVHMIPGPVDTESHVPPVMPERDHRMVVAAGRIEPRKGFDRIIQALPPDLSLVIAGQPYDAEYAGYLNDLARGKAVTIDTGLNDQALGMLYQTAGLFVCASTHVDYRGRFCYKPEVLGLMPLEALSCGLPALVSSAGALPELASLPGCRCFEDDSTLVAMLRSHAAGTLGHPAGQDMHEAVVARHGPLAVGRELLAVLLGRG